MASRGIFSLVSLILVAGGCLLMLFILLAGAINAAPVNKWYFLEAATSKIPGAPAISRWSYWNVCGVKNGHTSCMKTHNYSKVHPAFPFDPPNGKNFGTKVGVPKAFVGTKYYFLMTRFAFSFMLIALFFAVCALFTGVLALCTRIGSYLSGLLTAIAMVFQGVQAALVTVAFIKGRNNFRRNGQTANIGKYAFAFEWAAFACFFLSTVLFCVGGGRKKDAGTGSSRKGFFRGRRSKSTRSAGSFGGDKEYS